MMTNMTTFFNESINQSIFIGFYSCFFVQKNDRIKKTHDIIKIKK